MAEQMVSVLVPCYNHEKFINDLLDSLIKQTYRNIELLIFDDCSKDNSWEIICSREKELLTRFSSVYIHRNDQNHGLPYNLNKMIKQSKGEIIKLIASDDFLESTYFEKVVDVFSKTSCDLVMTNAYVVEEESKLDNIKVIDKVYKRNPFKSHKRVFERIFNGNFICAPSTSVSRNIYRKYGLYDEKIRTEDLEYWLRIFKNDNTKIVYIDSPLAFYRRNKNSMSSKIDQGNLEKRLIVMHDASIEARIKYKEYISSFKYNRYMQDVIIYYFKIAAKNSFQDLINKTYDDANILSPMFKIILALRMHIKI